jgi:cytochrome oxidase Cu insertion factor (SCO1/SenC/PrrC family)
MRHVRIALLPVIMLIVTAGCGNGTPVAVPPTTGSTSTPVASATATPTPATALPTATTAAPSGLLAMTLTDVRSGETFSLAQFEGKVTIVQHMAVW